MAEADIPTFSSERGSTTTTLFELYNALAFSVLVIDGRPEADWEKAHVYKARCFGPKTDEEKRAFIERSLKPRPGASVSYTHWFAVEVSDSDFTLVSTALSELSESPPILRRLTSFESFLSKFPHYCEGTSDRVADVISPSDGLFPSCILDGALYLGTGKHAISASVISALSISHIVNVSCEFACVFAAESSERSDGDPVVDYCHIVVRDEAKVELAPHFDTVFAFIDDALKAGGTVLIHCQMGRSRSGTLAIGYYMHSQKCSLWEAYTRVEKCRPIVRPNEGFFEQLVALEKRLFAGRSTADELVAARMQKPEDMARKLKASLAQALKKH